MCLSACNHSAQEKFKQSYAIQVTDAKGDLVQLKQPAQRIVCLFEASLDNLYMLGAGQRVIAIPGKVYTSSSLYHAYSILDARIKEKKLATPSQSDSASSLESIISLKPDLVVMYANQPDSITLLRSMNIPVYAAQSENLTQTLKELQDLGTLTGQQQRASHLIQFIQHELAVIQKTTDVDFPIKKTVYYAWSGGRIFSSSGRDSMPNSMITLAGAENIIQAAIDQPTVNPENLIEWNPDAILLWNSDAKLIYQQPELQGLKAVKQQQVFNLMPSFFYNPHTPKILLAANQLHHWLYRQNDAASRAKQDQYRILNMFYGTQHGQQLAQLTEVP
ncbi:MAG: ABC transporter substrate-binding protein [Acinetobacter populi]|jgi:iron complex transport system substrate-binding protein|uniref:ABC transporter substrate-binding protein n=1 Tax=Acinetobacter populi TaxID=1582270 RepID=UPI0023551FCF|nr:ABC transporter substrate-binding protein [Acinetobacter populi]MCH4247337.1 ABC transporter substrate-binding protein [Acinetobacter populi]